MAAKHDRGSTVGTAGRSHEMAFNYALAEALRHAVAEWDEKDLVVAERTRLVSGQQHRGKRLDLLVSHVESRPIVVETSYGARDADRDARSRLGLITGKGKWLIDAAVAVHINEENRDLDAASIADSLKRGQTLRYAAHHLSEGKSVRWPASGFLEGRLYDFAEFLTVASLPKGVLKNVSDEVARSVRQAAYRLAVDSAPWQREEIAETVSQRSTVRGLNVAMVLWLNALIIHHRLQFRDARVPKIKDCLVSGRFIPQKLLRAWQQILKTNWAPVFGPAAHTLESTIGLVVWGVSQALERLHESVVELGATKVGPYFNVGAEIFPRLAEDRKESAAFYTNAPVAEFLASLAISEDGGSWGRRDPWKGYVVADFACGTGTLLRAAYRRVRSLHQRSGKATRKSLAGLHKSAMEYGLVGQDISAIAVHLTSSSLAALGEGTPYGDTRIDWLPVGDSEFGDVQIGSLEYLEDGPRRNFLGGVTSSEGGGSSGAAEGLLHGKQIRPSCILMNPPYSRTKKGGGTFDIQGLSSSERKRCQARWSRLAKRNGVQVKPGMAASFLALADKLLEREGRLGFVLPLSAAAEESWSSVRARIEENFRDVTAVTTIGHSLSADTGMEEMLLIAEKRGAQGSPKLRASEDPEENAASGRIRCVSLYQPLDDAAFSGEVARAVKGTLRSLGGGEAPVRVGDEVIGAAAAYTVREPGEPWVGVGVQRPQVAEVAAALARGEFRALAGDQSARISVPMTTMTREVAVGPTHHLIGHLVGNEALGAFEWHRIAGGFDRDPRALWNTDAKSQKTMRIRPTHWGVVPKHLEARDQQSMLSQRSTLFVQRNMRWTSQAILFATTRRSAMGGPNWVALSHEDRRVLCALALWGNSTLGMLVHWTRGGRAHHGRSRLQVKGIKKVPIPRVSRLPDDALDSAARVFEKLRATKLLAAKKADCDPARDEIDRAVLSLFSFPEWAYGALVDLRRAWCAEPSVRGRNAARGPGKP